MKRSLAFMLSIILMLLCFQIPPFSATVKAESTIDLSRDINGDREVDLLDVTILSRYVAGWSGLTYIEENLDITDDGSVDLRDITHLSRLVAGWDIDIDFTVNNPNYYWPYIYPSDAAAGTSFLSASDVTPANSPLSKFLLTTENNPTMPFNVACHIASDNTITAIIPAGIKLNAMKADISFLGQSLMQGNMPVYSNLTEFDFTKPVTLSLVTSGGSTIIYTVYVMALKTGLPSFSITTQDFQDIDSKYDYISGAFYAGGGDKSVCSYASRNTISTMGTVKGRGNSSWSFPKKSFTIKFDSKQQLFDLPAHKEWVLSANYADRTLMRNAIAFNLARNVGMETVMEIRFVDLWVNGVYNGNYQLIEKIEIGPERVNITDFDSTLAPDQVGYLIETNGHNASISDKYLEPYGLAKYDSRSGDIFFKSLHYNSYFTIKKPSDTKLNTLPRAVAETYIAYIYDFMDKLESSIKTKSFAEASKYLDMEAMAKWYLAVEFTVNRDSRLFCSCFMYKDVDGKMKMGPVWDFDLGLGNGEYVESPLSNYLDGSTWFADLLAMPEFKALAKKIWTESQPELQKTSSFIQQTQAMLSTSQLYNFRKWTIAEFKQVMTGSQLASPKVFDLVTYDQQMEYMNTFITDRFTFINNKISRW